MGERNEYTPGTFCWIELATTNAGVAKKFYTGLFGWTYNDIPAGDDMVYSMAQLKNLDAGALCQIDEDMKAQGVVPHWLSYVSVTSSDETAKKAKTLGATVVKEPFDVFDVGRMAVLQDPARAFFAIWQPKAHIGARIVNEHGAFCWNELMTRDVDRAGKFYTELFGWGTQVAEMGPSGKYTSFMNGDRPAGGMMQITEEMGEVPPNWLVYFAVDDCDGTVSKAMGGEGKTLVPPTDLPEVGRFAVIEDPTGGVLGVIKLDNPQP